jgi:hypothetical protein
MFGSKRHEVAERQITNEEHTNIIIMTKARMRWVGHVASMDEMWNILVRKPEWMNPLGKMDCREIWYGLDSCGSGSGSL